jgi:hypothetical protein
MPKGPEATIFDPLIQHPDFRWLREFQPNVNPFRLLGIHDDEVKHSKLLARLLGHTGPLGHGAKLWPRLLETLLQSAPDRSAVPASLSENLLHAQFTGQTERWRIDVLLLDEQNKFLIAIENKVWAMERDGQIASYQATLEAKFPNWKGLFLFLTPEGRPARTNDPTSRFPCVALSWGSIGDAIWPLLDQDSTGLLKLLVTNIRENFVKNDELSAKARALWTDHESRKALLLLLENRPDLGDIQEKLLDRVNRATGKALKVDLSTQRRQTVEVKIFDSAWKEKGFPVTYMFHHYEGFRPAVRVLIDSGLRKQFAKKLNEIALIDPVEIDGNFTPIRDWKTWCKVFNEDDYPEKWRIDDVAFNDETVDAFMERFQEQYDRLRRIMGQF